MNNGVRRFRRWTWARRVTAGAFLALLVLGALPWFPWVKGSMTATPWFGVVPLVDPLAALEVTLASRTVQLSGAELCPGLVVMTFPGCEGGSGEVSV